MDRIRTLVAAAQARTGLTDFGGDGYREGLDRLVAALDGEARLNDRGRAAMDAQIVDLLANRLWIEGWHARHPEIADERIARPLIGLGLPRTGSTALACLLGADPATRSLLTWESMHPCLPPDADTGERAGPDGRLALVEAAMTRRATLFPRMTAMLPSTATSPTECQLFMAQDFKSQIFQAFAHIPSYVAWLNHQADLVPTYRHVRRVFRLLQWRAPHRPWRMKNPSHSLFIGALDTVFPDARFVMTHRDIAGVAPSVADVYLELRRAYSNDVDPLAIGRETSDFCELAMRRMIAFRAAGNEHRFFDIQFDALQHDPFPSLDALYAFLGEDLTDAARAGMAAWRREKPRETQIYARTDPATFGLDRAALRARFRFYSERFAVVPATHRQETAR